ncbi:hypothetical protein [Rhodohalobacter halophilus]|uniref:hypothetical protein n=1 Tax=Rhodohalobacter halophilus TaxID=1812810 RepID=UPI00114CF8DE|nr:hypothetical protein [Rhodohalobacter halophilus]
MSLIIPVKKHIWKIASIGMGLIISIMVIHIMQFLNYTLYQTPDGVDLTLQQNYTDFILNNPQFLAGVLFSNITGSFTGGAIAKLTHYSVSILMAGWVGFVLMMLEVFNLLSVEYPVWFWILTVALYIPSAWAGAYFVSTFQHK